MLYSRYATREHIDVNENNSQLDKKGDWVEHGSIDIIHIGIVGICSLNPALLSIHVLLVN